jgi:GNAT superfamily N-acetyltransferase
MSELLLEQFDLSPAHPWGNETLRLTLCDVYGWRDSQIDGNTWVDDEAKWYLGLDGEQNLTYWGLAKADHLPLAIAALDDKVSTESVMAVDFLVVSREDRSCGYGTEMMHRLEGIARDAGAMAMQLNCEFDVRGFYRKLDYKCIDFVHGLMEKRL